jgi:hypothetical protein
MGEICTQKCRYTHCRSIRHQQQQHACAPLPQVILQPTRSYLVFLLVHPMSYVQNLVTKQVFAISKAPPMQGTRTSRTPGALRVAAGGPGAANFKRKPNKHAEVRNKTGRCSRTVLFGTAASLLHGLAPDIFPSSFPVVCLVGKLVSMLACCIAPS